VSVARVGAHLECVAEKKLRRFFSAGQPAEGGSHQPMVMKMSSPIKIVCPPPSAGWVDETIKFYTPYLHCWRCVSWSLVPKFQSRLRKIDSADCR
jgi:hypothetical protein